MLLQRVITALVLLAVLLPTLFYASPEPFCALLLVLLAAAAWEWARLCGWAGQRAVWLGVVCAALCAASWWAGWLRLNLTPLWLLASAVWVLAGGALLRGQQAAWLQWPAGARRVAGVLALWVAWLAACQARVIGVNFLLSVLVLVWAADVFAYFSGRAFGRRKLAPAISPGKSWEGVWGGLAGAGAVSAVWLWLESRFDWGPASLFREMAQQGWWLLLLALPFLVVMSVVGDLVESLIKRAAGVKDSSRLLPGHGGVLDRVDALLTALPIALMIHSLQAA